MSKSDWSKVNGRWVRKSGPVGRRHRRKPPKKRTRTLPADAYGNVGLYLIQNSDGWYWGGGGWTPVADGAFAYSAAEAPKVARGLGGRAVARDRRRRRSKTSSRRRY